MGGAGLGGAQGGEVGVARLGLDEAQEVMHVLEDELVGSDSGWGEATVVVARGVLLVESAVLAGTRLRKIVLARWLSLALWPSPGLCGLISSEATGRSSRLWPASPRRGPERRGERCPYPWRPKWPKAP